METVPAHPTAVEFLSTIFGELAVEEIKTSTTKTKLFEFRGCQSKQNFIDDEFQVDVASGRLRLRADLMLFSPSTPCSADDNFPEPCKRLPLNSGRSPRGSVWFGR